MLKVMINRSTNKTEEVVFIKSESDMIKSLSDFDSKRNHKIISIVFKLLAFVVVPCLAFVVWLYNKEHYVITTSAFITLFSWSFVGFLFLSKKFSNDFVRYDIKHTNDDHDYKDVIWFYAKNYYGQLIYVGLTETHITVIMPEKLEGIFSAIDYTKPLFDFDFKQNYKIVTKYDFVEPSEKMLDNINVAKQNFYNSFCESVGLDVISEYIKKIEKCVKPLIHERLF